MALTKIGPSLGGSADIITVTQTSHTFVSNDRGKAVRMNNNSGTPQYVLARANTTANADALGIIIHVADGNTFTMATSGRITVDYCVPSGVAGTVLFLPTAVTGGAAMGVTDSGHLTSTEPSGNNEVSKPMAVITIDGSEMIMLQQRGEVISTAGISIADDAITTAKILDDAVTADKLANSINAEITANTAKVTNATHTGDVTGATALTIAAGAVDMAMLATTAGTAGSGTFLRGDGQWQAAGGLRGIVVLNPQGIDNTSTGALGVIAPHPWVGCRPTNAGDNGSAFFTGAVPSDFTTLESAKLVCLGVEGSTNVRLGTNTCKIAAHSEINTTHSNSMATADYAITTNEIMHIDISSLFTNLAANDSFAFNIRRNGTHANDTVTTFYIYSAILEYS